MAIKIGMENKRNVIVAGVLGCVLLILVMRQFLGPSTPAPAPPPLQPPVGLKTPPAAAKSESSAEAPGPEAKKVANAGLDPSLHLEKLALSESIEYAGSGRNLFSAEAPPPVVIEPPVSTARNNPPPMTPPVYTPPPPPAIDLRYFGYSAGRDGKKSAFLIHGEDIFEASAGEIVSHRYKVVTVDARSIQVTDLSYNNTQTLPLVAN